MIVERYISHYIYSKFRKFYYKNNKSNFVNNIFTCIDKHARARALAHTHTHTHNI